MAQCEQCGKHLTVEFKSGDGFCSDECRSKFNAAKTNSDEAQDHIRHLLQEVLPRAEWRSIGVCRWSSTGHKLGETASLWAGRALLGVAGDLLHVETSILGIAGITADDTLVIARIGELGVNETVRPESVFGTRVSKERTLTGSLAQLRVTQFSNGLRIVNTGTGDTLEDVVFPACFLPQNETFAGKLTSALGTGLPKVVTAPSITGAPRKALAILLLTLSILLWLGIIGSIVFAFVASKDLEREHRGIGILLTGLMLAAIWIAAKITKAWWNMGPPEVPTSDTDHKG